MKEQEDVSLGLLYTILTDQPNAAKVFSFSSLNKIKFTST